MAQDLSELARGEFARSTSTADHLGQPLLVREERHLLIVIGYAGRAHLASLGSPGSGTAGSPRFALSPDRVRRARRGFAACSPIGYDDSHASLARGSDTASRVATLAPRSGTRTLQVSKIGFLFAGEGVLYPIRERAQRCDPSYPIAGERGEAGEPCRTRSRERGEGGERPVPDQGASAAMRPAVPERAEGTPHAQS